MEIFIEPTISVSSGWAIFIEPTTSVSSEWSMFIEPPKTSTGSFRVVNIY
jgi:hypothetical protein